jgi:hypothetical protein
MTHPQYTTHESHIKQTNYYVILFELGVSFPTKWSQQYNRMFGATKVHEFVQIGLDMHSYTYILPRIQRLKIRDADQISIDIDPTTDPNTFYNLYSYSMFDDDTKIAFEIQFLRHAVHHMMRVEFVPDREFYSLLLHRALIFDKYDLLVNLMRLSIQYRTGDFLM